MLVQVFYWSMTLRFVKPLCLCAVLIDFCFLCALIAFSSPYSVYLSVTQEASIQKLRCSVLVKNLMVMLRMWFSTLQCCVIVFYIHFCLVFKTFLNKCFDQV